MHSYLIAYAASALLGLLLTPVVIQFAKRWSLVDQPGPRRIHRSPTARIGGVALVVSAFAAAIPAFAISRESNGGLTTMGFPLGVIAGAAMVVFFAGLLDDVGVECARAKLLVVITAAVWVYASGVRLRVPMEGHWFGPEWRPLDFPLTVLWITTVTVGMNFIDGLDGLAAGIAAICCGALAVVASSTGQSAVCVALLSLLGSLCAFLLYNQEPAKVFLGDCGSLFLGFTLAVLGIVCSTAAPGASGLALPVLALGVPLMDAIFTVVRRRLLQRRSLFSPELGHIHHRLLASGLRPRTVVLIIYLISATGAGVGIVAFKHPGPVGVAAFGTVLAALVLLFAVSRTIDIPALVTSLKAAHRRKRDAVCRQRIYDEMQLRLQASPSAQHWWGEVCTTAEMLGLDSVSYDPGTPGHTKHEWNRNDADPLHNVVFVRFAGRCELGRCIWRTAMSFPLGETIDSVCIRLVLFERLVSHCKYCSEIHSEGIEIFVARGPRASGRPQPTAVVIEQTADGDRESGTVDSSPVVLRQIVQHARGEQV